MSANTTYLTRCPSCGAQLTHHAGHPDAAPWTCVPCMKSFWVAELSHEAREMYRPWLHDWGHGDAPNALREAVLKEREVARERGTSTLPEHIGMLSKEDIVQVHKWNLHPDFKKLLKGKH